ncbi:MAG: serine hydrolase [Candidatus Omnitrophica bacterium]|nr:serine hydrolase [Candidatus Omnitrophota bacterium]MCG2703067.1 serine hydrolase [Candidatus Omnitrophota bacterium]
MQLFTTYASAKTASKQKLTAQAALIMDADSGTVLFKRNANLRLPSASTVKVLTATIIMEELSTDKQVVISKRAAGIAPSKAYLREGAQYKVKDLLQGFLMSSANDAGVALTEAVSGTEFQFSLLMNEKAKAMGARNSFFLNATGLPEGGKRQYSTVYDLALFMRKCLAYPQLVGIMRTKNAEICGSDGKSISLRNHNKFLWRSTNDLIGKTGFTKKAGHCFLGMFSKGKRRFIVAILDSSKPWDDLEYLMNKKY